MAQATDSSTTSRRSFLASAALASAVLAPTVLIAATADADRTILDLERQIDDKCGRLVDIAATIKMLRSGHYPLFCAVKATEGNIQAAIDAVNATPEAMQLPALNEQQDVLAGEVVALVYQMFDISTDTPLGRQAKLRVLMNHVWPDDAMLSDDPDSHIALARCLLCQWAGL
jgi:hypothetical protein